MNVYVTEEAAAWYREELNIQKTAHLRFYVRYGGFGGVVPGFSLGVGLDTPIEINASYKLGNIIFFIEAKDSWYFDGKDLKVTFNTDLNEPEFNYM